MIKVSPTEFLPIPNWGRDLSLHQTPGETEMVSPDFPKYVSPACHVEALHKNSARKYQLDRGKAV
jgi:hypothetical protein